MVTIESFQDPLTLLAAAAARTKGILLGTCIVPIYPRHPIAMAQQVQVLAQLAPGRFRLGVGVSHPFIMEGIFGFNVRAPLGHLSEYLQILKALLQQGSVDFDGRYYKARAEIVSPVDVPVIASALGPKAFELCGAHADGAIPWVCPAPYLRDVALPAMKAGAGRASRPVPPLIDMLPVCVHDDPDEVRTAIRECSPHPTLGFYQKMWAAAGFPEATEGRWSDAMVDACVVWGDESAVAGKLEALFALGATEILAFAMPAGQNRDASQNRTLRLLGQLSTSVSG